MFVVALIALGWIIFVGGVITAGIWLRRHRSKEAAVSSTRIVHFLYFACMIFPGVAAFFYPGLSHFDELFGIPSLPLKPILLVIGILLVLPGLYLGIITNKDLLELGHGAAAFRLTQHIVELDIYKYTRNPMSLGYYLVCIGVGLIAGSTSVTLGAILGIIPAHVLFLKFFEELELELRFGTPYLEYKRRVPFLIPRFTPSHNKASPHE